MRCLIMKIQIIFSHLILLSVVLIVQSEDIDHSVVNNGNILVQLSETADLILRLNGQEQFSDNSTCLSELAEIYKQLRNNSLWAFKSNF